MKILNYLTIIMVTTTAALHITAAEQPMPAYKPVDLGNLSVLPKEIILEILSKNINWDAKTVNDALRPVLAFFVANKYAASLKEELLKSAAIKDLKEKIDLYQKLAQYEARHPQLVKEEKNAIHIATMNADINFLKNALPKISKFNLLSLINAKDNSSEKNTALHIAVITKNPNPDIVKLLLDHGANPNIADDIEAFPLTLALRYLAYNQKIYDIAKLLIQKTSCQNIEQVYKSPILQAPILKPAKDFVKENLPTNCNRDFFR